jgi:transketolase
VGELAQQLRVDAIRMSTSAGSGHPTSSMSSAEIAATLLSRHLRYDWQRPDLPANDHLIFSKGHASPLLYAMFKAAGVVTDQELLSTYRRPGWQWQGHPTPVLPWVDVATGSLGQGLPDAVGIALAGRFLDKMSYHVWVLAGDSEMAEGSIWEALSTAAGRGLGNLTTVVDVNGLGMRGPTALQWDLSTYASRIEAFGCRALVVDGHDVSSLDHAMTEARNSQEPTVILARTVKGKGFAELENLDGWHGRPLPVDMADRAVAALGGIRDIQVPPNAPPAEPRHMPAETTAGPVRLPRYELGAQVATRTAYGQALLALGIDKRLVVLDAEVGNSTQADVFQHQFPERYFDVFTAEQQMIAAAIGLSVRGYIAFAATFGAFLTRAHDFIRMAAVSQANIRLVGSHAGVEVGPDGPSQMALEDLSMMRSVHGSTVLYPSDAASTVQLVSAMVGQRGVVYMRTTRGAYPVLYGSEESFPVGGSKTVVSSGHDEVTLLAAGVTVHTCLSAADRLNHEGVPVRVIDLYSVKPIDATGLESAVNSTKGRVVIVEDHHPEGGLGEAVLSALASTGTPVALEHLAVRNMPTSGLADEMMFEARIGLFDVITAVHRLMNAYPHGVRTQFERDDTQGDVA